MSLLDSFKLVLSGMGWGSICTQNAGIAKLGIFAVGIFSTWLVYFQLGQYISNMVSIFPTSLVYFQPYNLSTSTKCTPAHTTSEARFQVRSPESALDLAAWLVNRAVDLGTSSLKK